MSPKSLKPLRVGAVSSGRTHMVVEIFLDRDRLDFFGQVGDSQIRAATADECKAAVRMALQKFTGFEWHRFIEADIEQPGNWHHHSRDGKPHHFKLSGEFSRFERAQKFNQALKKGEKPGWLRRPFFEDLDESSQEHMKEMGELLYANDWYDPAESSFHHDEDYQPTLIIPYTTELWEALVSIEATVEKARLHIKDLLNPKDSGKKLLAIGIQQLGLKQLAAGKK